MSRNRMFKIKKKFDFIELHKDRIEYWLCEGEFAA